MMTFEETAVVDASHRLTLQVPSSVTPGEHHVVVMIDEQPVKIEGGAIWKGLSPQQRSEEFRTWVAALKPRPLPADPATTFSRESIYD
jgi:hypothetical protein